MANNDASSSACVDDRSGGSASQGLSKAKEDGSNPSLSRRHGHRQVRLSGACGIGIVEAVAHTSQQLLGRSPLKNCKNDLDDQT